MSATNISRAHAPLAAENVQPVLRVVESDPKAGRSQRAGNNWFLAVMILASVLFAATLFNYVLSPAAITVANTSTSSSESN